MTFGIFKKQVGNIWKQAKQVGGQIWGGVKQTVKGVGAFANGVDNFLIGLSGIPVVGAAATALRSHPIYQAVHLGSSLAVDVVDSIDHFKDPAVKSIEGIGTAIGNIGTDIENKQVPNINDFKDIIENSVGLVSAGAEAITQGRDFVQRGQEIDAMVSSEA